VKAFVREFLDCPCFYTLGGGGELISLKTLKYEYPHYLKELEKKKIIGKVITSPKNKTILQELYKYSSVAVKSFPKLKGQVHFTIFGKKLAIYSAQEKPLVTIIEDQNAVQVIKTYFDILWAIAE